MQVQILYKKHHVEYHDSFNAYFFKRSQVGSSGLNILVTKDIIHLKI